MGSCISSRLEVPRLANESSPCCSKISEISYCDSSSTSENIKKALCNSSLNRNRSNINNEFVNEWRDRFETSTDNSA